MSHPSTPGDPGESENDEVGPLPNISSGSGNGNSHIIDNGGQSGVNIPSGQPPAADDVPEGPPPEWIPQNDDDNPHGNPLFPHENLGPPAALNGSDFPETDSSESRTASWQPGDDGAAPPRHISSIDNDDPRSSDDMPRSSQPSGANQSSGSGSQPSDINQQSSGSRSQPSDPNQSLGSPPQPSGTSQAQGVGPQPAGFNFNQARELDPRPFDPSRLQLTANNREQGLTGDNAEQGPKKISAHNIWHPAAPMPGDSGHGLGPQTMTRTQLPGHLRHGAQPPSPAITQDGLDDIAPAVPGAPPPSPVSDARGEVLMQQAHGGPPVFIKTMPIQPYVKPNFWDRSRTKTKDRLDRIFHRGSKGGSQAHQNAQGASAQGQDASAQNQQAAEANQQVSAQNQVPAAQNQDVSQNQQASEDNQQAPADNQQAADDNQQAPADLQQAAEQGQSRSVMDRIKKMTKSKNTLKKTKDVKDKLRFHKRHDGGPDDDNGWGGAGLGQVH